MTKLVRELGGALRILRRCHGFTMGYVARALGVSVVQVSDVEIGDTDNVDLRKRMADLYGTDLDALEDAVEKGRFVRERKLISRGDL